MDVILLERITKLGQMGDTVTVKDGYARNFLLPKGKALRANKANMAHFESQRVQLEAKNLERKSEAETVAKSLDGSIYVAVRSAGETGQLYGSVAARDVVASLEENGFTIGRSQVELQAPIKIIGLHVVTINLHPEVQVQVTMNVARSEDEAIRQAAGEDLTSRDAFDGTDEAEEDELNLDEIFDNPDDVDLTEDGEAEGEDSTVTEEAGETEEAAEAAEAVSETETEEAAPFVDAIVLLDGVGEKTTEALEAEGVTTLTQILEMSDEDLAALSEKVGAGDQWETKEWKIQAQEMKDGKPPRAKVDQELAAKMAADS